MFPLERAKGSARARTFGTANGVIAACRSGQYHDARLAAKGLQLLELSMRFRSAIFMTALSCLALPAAGAPVDCSKGAIPAGPAKCTLNGAPFTVDLVKLDPIAQRTQGP